MNAIYNPHSVNRRSSSVAYSDPRTELARHCLDLRVYAVIMLSNAVLLVYCGFRVFDVGETVVSGEPVWNAIPHDPLSLFALATFVVIAGFCLLEARRSWRDATLIRTQKGFDVMASATANSNIPRQF